MKLRICIISDTHGQHYKLTNLPNADMIIHTGDISVHGTKHQIKEFLDWYSSLTQYNHKIFIGGNHDFFLDFDHHKSTGSQEQLDEMMPDNLIYLNDSEVIVEGLRIWGSPVQPWFLDWGFNRMPGEDIQKHWNLIPKDGIDILCTHGPPANTKLDRCLSGKRVGCISLMNKILDTKSIFCSIFGHIHEARGHETWNVDNRKIELFNASVLNLKYEMENEPFLIEVDIKTKEVKIIS